MRGHWPKREMKNIKAIRFIQRKKRVRAKAKGDKIRPRLSIFRSNREIYAQIIDDTKRTTLVSFASRQLKKEKREGKSKSLMAEVVGEDLAKLAKIKKIGSVVFDRAGYKYHGRIKALAEGARKGGLKF